MLFVTPPLYVLVTDLMLSQWKGLWCSWALYSSSTLIAGHIIYRVQLGAVMFCVLQVIADAMMFVSSPFPSLTDALPFNLFMATLSFTFLLSPNTNHQPLIIIQNVLLWGRRQKVARTWLHCVKPVIGGIVWKVRWQLDLKQAITWNPTTSLMAALSSPLYQLPLSSLELS